MELCCIVNGDACVCGELMCDDHWWYPEINHPHWTIEGQCRKIVSATKV